jgi:hypothetical protein
MATIKYLLKTAMYALPAVFAAVTCLAQQTQNPQPTMVSFVGGYGGYGRHDNSYSYVNNRALTPGESFDRGRADIVRSKGDYNLLTSQAAINAAEATKNDIQNRDLWIKTYFQMRRDNQAARIVERGPRPTADEFTRYAQMGKPKPLGRDQLDAVSGKIYWPRLLRTEQFAANRALLDEVFLKKIQYGDISMEDLMKAREVANKMMDQLNEQIRDIPPMEYISTQQFLASLAYEVQIASG